MNEKQAADFILEMLSAPWQPGSLEPFRVPCDALRPDGRPCGESALVHRIDYVRPGDSAPGQRGLQTQYDIECPRCGRRTQIQA
jgi:hypothetical protein